MLSILWAYLKQLVVGNASQRALRFVIPLSFHETRQYVFALLQMHNETSDEVTLAMKQWNSVSALPLSVIPKSVWPKDYPRIRIQSHIKSTLGDAVNLLKATGRVVSTEDEKYLSLLLTHPCGWSATYQKQMDEPWVHFFHEQYPQLINLTLILDSMTYPEELIDFPDGYDMVEQADFFLLATSDSFFVYDTTDGNEGLRPAGATLKDVYNGMKDWRWADSSENPWGFVDDVGCLDPELYFPHYHRLKNGNFEMALYGRGYIKEYPGRKRNVLFHNMFRKFKY